MWDFDSTEEFSNESDNWESAESKIYLLPFFLAVSLDTENSLSAILLGSQQNDVTRSKTKEKVMCFLFT